MPSDTPRRPNAPTGRPTTRRSSGKAPVSSRPAPSHRRMRIADVRRVRRQVLFTLYAVLTGEVVAAALTTPLLHIKSVQVKGAESLPAAETAQLLSTAKPVNGTNFLLAPASRIQAQLRALPWVRSAVVHRRFPHTVTVDVTLREPVAQVQTTNGLWEIDADGLPIRIVRHEMAARLPMIVWQQPTVVKPGAVFGDHALQSALSLSHWAQKETLIHLAKIEVDQSDNICLNMQDGIPIKFGPDTETERKQTLITNLYRREPDIARRIQQIDISCPSDVACTPRVVLPAPASTALQPSVTVVNRP